MTGSEQWRDEDELRRLVADLRARGGGADQARARALDELLAALPGHEGASGDDARTQDPERLAAARATAAAALRAQVASGRPHAVRRHLGLSPGGVAEDAETVTAAELEELLREVRLGEEMDVGSLAIYADAEPSGEELAVDLDIDTGGRPLPDGTVTLRTEGVVFVARLRRHLSFERVRGSIGEWRFGVRVQDNPARAGDVVPLPGLQRQLAPAASGGTRQARARAVASDLGLVCSLRELPTRAVALTVAALEARWQDQLVHVETVSEGTASSWVVPLAGAGTASGAIVLPPRDVDEVRLGVDPVTDVDGELLARSIRAAETPAGWRRIAEVRAGTDLAEEILGHL